MAGSDQDGGGIVRITEIFHSIQGEGEFAGTPSVFVRTTGCNLRCWFCDTPYSSWRPEGSQCRWQDVLDLVVAHDERHVVITGGEPLLQRDVVPLTEALAKADKFVTVETAGTVYRPVHADLMSISPKLAGSTPGPANVKAAEFAGHWTSRHAARREVRPVLQRLRAEYSHQFKFVVDNPGDLDDVTAFLSGFPPIDPQRIWLMPQALTSEQLEVQSAWLEPRALALGYRFSSRLQIAQFGNVRGK